MATFDPDRWLAQLMECQHLPEADMKVLCDRVRSILLEESNIQPVSSPVTICGDIHGQFWDLLELLRKGGPVPETSYIFMARMYSFSELGRTAQTLDRVTLSTADTIAWRRSRCCSYSRQSQNMCSVSGACC